MINSLTTHLFIEFYYNGGKGLFLNEQLLEGREKKLLFERYGIFNGCEEVVKKLVTLIRNLRPSRDITLDDCGLNFLKTIHLKIEDNRSALATYSPDDTVVGEKGVFEEITIIISSSLKDEYEQYAFITHELIHAKQDYDLRQKGSSLWDEMKKVNYRGHAKIGADEEEVKKQLGLLLYYLNQYEIGGFVSMLKSEFEKVKNHVFNDIQDVINYIKTTGPYRTYIVIQTYANVYGNLDYTDEDKKKIMDILSEISDYNFPSFLDFSRWAKGRARKVLNKMDEIIPKIACETLKIRSRMVSRGYLV